jgi:GntR family transcriptional regulator/MocR family aminotransferase
MGAGLAADGLLLDLDPRILSWTQRLMAALRTGIQRGQLPAGVTLPPSRALAAELGCSRWVVTEAYGQLVSEGYLVATTGSGTRVGHLGAVPSGAVADSAPPRRPRLDLSPGTPDLSAFPRAQWAEAYRRAVRTMPTDLLAGRSLLATLPARVALTDHLRRTRQVQEDPTQRRRPGGWPGCSPRSATTGSRSRTPPGRACATPSAEPASRWSAYPWTAKGSGWTCWHS